MIKIRGREVTTGQAAVWGVLAEYGPLPDLALVPLTQHVALEHQSSSGIRTRRRELQDCGLVHEVSRTKSGSGRGVGVFDVYKRRR